MKLTVPWYKPRILNLYNTDSLEYGQRTQRVITYELNVFIMDSAVIRWISNPHQVNLADVLCKVISKAQSLYIKQRFAKGVHNRLF